MKVTDEILNEWSFRCHDGVVDLNDPKKLLILKEILDENGIDLGEARPKKIKEPEIEPEKGTIDYCVWVLRTQANVTNERILKQIKAIYYNNPGQKEFIDNFRKYDINQLDTIFSAYTNYLNVGSNLKGIGRGEFTLILGLKNSRSGGTSEKDILIGDDIYDVKELANGEFRTGSSGYITTTVFKNNFDYFVSLLLKVAGEDLQDLKELGNEKIEKHIIELIKYYQGAFKSGNISEGTLNKIKNLSEELHEYFKENKKDYGDAVPVKIGGIKFLISQDTFNKIKSGELKTVDLGTELAQQKSILHKLKNHPWVVNSENFTNDLNQIWKDYLKGVTGLIMYDEGKFELYKHEDLLTKFRPFRIVQNQLSIIKIRQNNNQEEETIDEDYYEEEN